MSAEVSTAVSAAHTAYRRSLLPAQRVRELSQRRPLLALRDSLANWAVIVGAWLLAAQVGTWWAIAVAIPVIGNCYYALYIIGHDGMHRRLSADQGRNDLFTDVLVFAPIGAINRINNRNHLKHHQHLASELDPDRHKHGCFNKTTRLELLGYITAFTSLAKSTAHVFLPKHDAKSAITSEPRPSYVPRDIALLVAWHASLIVVLTVLFGWWGYLLLWWVPVFVFSILADNLRAFLEHSQLADDATSDEARLVTYVPNRLERRLMAPMNMNFHAAHHLWPSIPYYNLPAADAEMRKAPDADAITWRRSYARYLASYAAAIPIDGCQPAPARG